MPMARAHVMRAGHRYDRTHFTVMVTVAVRPA
jgi:hypothetical protein